MGRMHDTRNVRLGLRDRARAQSQRPHDRGDARQGPGRLVVRSTSWPIRAATAATTTAGRRRARAAGPTPTCCPISGAPRPGRAAQTLGAAATARSAPQFAKTPDTLFDAWLEAAQGGRAIPPTADYNGKAQEGFGRGQYTIRDGRRSSSARAYLRPARKRANLTVETGAHATRCAHAGHAGDRRRIRHRCGRPQARRGSARGDRVERRLQRAAAADALRHRPGRASARDGDRLHRRPAGRQEPAGPPRRLHDLLAPRRPARSMARCGSTAWR